MKTNALIGLVAACALTTVASAAARMRYLYSDKETIVCAHPCEVTAHPYLADGRLVATAKAGEPFGPLAAGSYLIRETVAPGKVRTRYLAVAKPGWTVVQLTCGTTGDKLDSVVHARRIPMNYYVGVNEAQVDTTFLGWQRDYGDEILLHLHPDSLGKIDPKFKTLKENWEAFTVPEIVERLKALDAWMQGFGFEPLRGFASYTPANTLVAAMREVGWDILHSIIPEQNWSDGHWAINHWGMPNQPFYIAADDFRKSVARGAVGNDVLGMGMNSYHLYMPHVVMWGDNVCSPSHFLRWHRTVESGDVPVRYENFLEDYLKVAEGMADSPYFLFTGYEFGRTFGTRSMTVHNRAGCELAIDKAKNGGKVVFATASDVADWFRRFRPTPAENVFTQRDYLAGTRIMDKPIDSGPSIAMEMRDYKACFAHLEPLPFYHYDYTIPWHFKAADVTAPADFARDDVGRVEVENRGACEVRISVAKALPRVTPVCLWDRELAEVPEGARVFVPPVLDDGRRHTVVELPKGFSGKLVLKCRATGTPDKAEFGGLVTPLWRVQTIGAGARRQCYAFVDTPLLSPCTVRFTCPKDCRIDALEKPLGAFKKGEVVDLEFTTRRTWYRFWGLAAGEIQPDAAGVAALERAAAEWKSFSDNAAENLAKTHAADDAFFKSVVPKDEKLLLDVDCFGNAVFGERSRARPFDRCVFAANDKVTAKEYSDGGISYGKGKSFWVHPRGLGLQVEGLDTLGLAPDAVVRVRLCTIAEKGEPLSYKVMVRSGWKKIFGYADEGQKPLVWNCPKERTPEGLFAFDVPIKDVSDGVLAIQLRTNQKQVLDDWFADGGFIARLERIVVTADLAPTVGAPRGAAAEFFRAAVSEKGAVITDYSAENPFGPDGHLDFPGAPLDEAMPRCYRLAGLRNVRDIGGWTGIRPGRVLRGSQLYAVAGCADGVDPTTAKVLTNDLGIATDLDLRGSKEWGILEYSEKGLAELQRIGIPKRAFKFPSYCALLGEGQREVVAGALRVFVEKKNYPVYVHCAGGADRTGSLVLILEALCGVPEKLIDIDYEMTSFATIYGLRTRDCTVRLPWKTFKDRIRADYPAPDLNASVRRWVEEGLGLSASEIASVRANLLMP